jgi:hypothetical protein
MLTDKINRLIIALSLFFAAYSCSKQEESTTYAVITSKLDIEDAKAVFIAAKGDGRTALYKVTDKANIEIIPLSEGKNNVFSEVNKISYVIGLDNGYFLMVCKTNYDSYLVRQADGQLFHLPKPIHSVFQANQNYDFYQSSGIAASGSGIYYISHSELVRVDISNPQDIKHETISAEGDKIKLFAVDKYGNVAYLGEDVGQQTIARYKNADGSFNPLPDAPLLHLTGLWVDPQGESIFFYNSDMSQNLVQITGNPFKIEDYGDRGMHFYCGLYTILKAKSKNRMLAIGGCTNLLDIYNPNRRVADIPYTDMDLYLAKYSVSSDNYYYLSGTSLDYRTVLQKRDPETMHNQMLINGQHDVYIMAVNNADEIVFGATRSTDGKLVVGAIDQAGNISLLDEASKFQIVSIIAFN